MERGFQALLPAGQEGADGTGALQTTQLSTVAWPNEVGWMSRPGGNVNGEREERRWKVGAVSIQTRLQQNILEEPLNYKEVAF